LSDSVVFVSYFRIVPTGQIGVFKRCVRLMSHLLDDYEIHLVNFGPVPQDDGTFAPLRSKVEIHQLPERSLGDELWELYRAVRPRALVLGEAPLRGNMRLSHRVASRRGLWQIAVENQYAPWVGRTMVRAFARIDRWLRLGLPGEGGLDDPVGPTEVVPPLVGRVRADRRGRRDRLCLIGYDRQTLTSGLALLRHLPATIGVDVVTVPDWLHLVDRRADELAGRDVDVLVSPADPALYGSVARARVVFGKAGFQQMVETILLGARVICRSAGGGIVRELVPEQLLPFVAWMRDDSDLPAVVATATGWFDAPVIDGWGRLLDDYPDTAAYAAERLRAMVEAAPRRRERG